MFYNCLPIAHHIRDLTLKAMSHDRMTDSRAAAAKHSDLNKPINVKSRPFSHLGSGGLCQPYEELIGSWHRAEGVDEVAVL